ncbi:uncharacterized protein LOC106674287 isoform X2 [Cimex lectularius]|uniref:Triokinase/FMN cyclase n=1 Tax=Cimex lectularius TaxID=79782 RepID=A0A8I6SDR7_CIMLE|nr:uncharacterized protein LOC106674287 isoform X2 [Cimex lectularius]
MQQNSLIDNTDSCIKSFLKGIQVAYPGLSVDVNSKIVMYNKDRQYKVALVSGGRAGHEPFGAGFVGENMLTGFILGTLHSSPPSSTIYTGMVNLLTKNKGGVLALVLNYMDNKLNFGTAVERLKLLGRKIESVYVSEDCVHGEFQTIDCGRRGCCGIALISKIIGGLTSKGFKLKFLKKEAEEINSRMYTLSAALAPSTLFEGKHFFKGTTERKMEIGMGLNGEKGIKTVKISSMKEIVESLLARLYQEAHIKAKNDVFVILINNLGICTDLEMYSIAYEVVTQIEKWNIVIKRVYVGKMMTSLDAKGFHITILNVTGKKLWITELDTNTDAFGWTFSAYSFGQAPPITFIEKKPNLNLIAGIVLTVPQSKIFEDILINICTSLEENESKLNQLDLAKGTGDFGTCLKRLASGIRNNIATWDLRDLSKIFFLISEITESQVGGMYGALYSLMMMGAANNSYDWVTIWKAALDKIYEYTNAKVGNATMQYFR